MAANRLWVGPVLEQLGRSAMHGELGFEVSDALASCDKLCLLGRRQPGLETTVDAVLAPPRVDRLVADAQVLGDLGDLAAGVDQVEHTTPELGRVATPSHAVPPVRTAASHPSYATPRNPRRTISPTAGSGCHCKRSPARARRCGTLWGGQLSCVEAGALLGHLAGWCLFLLAGW